MSFTSLSMLVEDAKAAGISLAELVVETELEDFNTTRDEIYERTEQTLDVMWESANMYAETPSKSLSGLTGGYASRLFSYNKDRVPLSGEINIKAALYALSCAEVNASMGVIAAAPTAGSCGILPGILFAVSEALEIPRKKQIRALLTASGIGAVIKTRATLSGASGGCQAECGSAAAIAAACACDLCDMPSDIIVNSVALTLKNVLGLACSPVCGLVEIPCVKRNGIFTSVALIAADMSMAGIKSVIPADEIIDAMGQIGASMPSDLRGSGDGGLAKTPAGKKLFETLEDNKSE